jgi:hypothetical protein
MMGWLPGQEPGGGNSFRRLEMKTAKTIVLAGFVLLVCAALAQAKPDFTGEWKLDVAKSDFGPMPAPQSMVQKVTHQEPSLKVVSTQVSERGEFTSERNYTTDGKECVNKMRDTEVKSTLKWDGDTLVIDSKFSFQDNAITTSEKWTLSADGKVLTIKSHFSSPQGEGDTTRVLNKQ